MKKYSKELTGEAGAPITGIAPGVSEPRGAVAYQDLWLLEKLSHFDRELIPERRIFAKGWGAYGIFTVTGDISRWSRSKLFEFTKKTELFVRFSRMMGERGSADAVRDICGMACKFYTEEGNWDLLCSSSPVSFLRSADHFPDLCRAFGRDPRTGLYSAQSRWDFLTLMPETFHQTTILMSDRGLPASFRELHFYAGNTYSLCNEHNVRVWCKFHIIAQRDVRNLTDAEAAAQAAEDPDSRGHDLSFSIDEGDYPRWTMYVQIMTEEQARSYAENPFDPTRVWPHGDFPLHEVGVIELRSNPTNYFAEVEQAAFSPAHTIPGIGFSPDQLLQSSLFACGDAQRYRLGVNYNEIPVNRPHCEVTDSHRDGFMRVGRNYGNRPSYSPNSQMDWAPRPGVMEPPLAFFRRACDTDPFRAGGELWRILPEEKRALLVENTARSMATVTKNVKYRHAVHCLRADEEYGHRMIKVLKLKPERVMELVNLTQEELIEATLNPKMR